MRSEGWLPCVGCRTWGPSSDGPLCGHCRGSGRSEVYLCADGTWLCCGTPVCEPTSVS
jgi:hypothetical protein